MSFDPEYQGFRTQFTDRLPARLEEIEAAWRQVREGGWSRESLALFHRLAHSLAGACAMFDLAAMAATARELEHLLKRLAVEPGEVSERRIESLLDRLRQAVPPKHLALL
ncbi:MAG TPA: Hpt domain-containing protein [Thermoanaerobaculia bacterium]|nr:Hpt domain-containing protein [Thermoanaerobaculia bacterium]